MDAVSEGKKYKKLEEIVIDGDLKKFFQAGAQLPQKKEKLIAFLRENVDLFA